MEIHPARTYKEGDCYPTIFTVNILGAVLQLIGDQTQFETHFCISPLLTLTWGLIYSQMLVFKIQQRPTIRATFWSPVRPQKDQLVENRHVGSTVSMHHTVVPRHIKHRTLTSVTATRSPLCPVGFRCILTGHTLLNHKTSRLRERRWSMEVVATLYRIMLGEPGNGRTETHCKRPPPHLPLCCLSGACKRCCQGPLEHNVKNECLSFTSSARERKDVWMFLLLCCPGLYFPRICSTLSQRLTPFLLRCVGSHSAD